MSLLSRVLHPAVAGRRHASLNKRGTTAPAASSSSMKEGRRCTRGGGGGRDENMSLAVVTRRHHHHHHHHHRRHLVCVRALATRSSDDDAAGRGSVAGGSHHQPAAAREEDEEEEEEEKEEVDESGWGGVSGELLVLSAVLTNAMYDTAAYAYEGYDGIGVPDDEATPLQNAFGFVFTIFCGWYFLRVVKKRGNRAKEFRVANTIPKEEREARDAEQLAKAKKLSPKDSFIGGVTGLGISFVLYGFAQTISASFDGRAVPDSYQARQISITVRTIVTGLAYLATFVYAANGTGLVALAAQKWLDKLTGVDLIDEAAEKWAAGGEGGEIGGDKAADEDKDKTA